ncbi:glycoside hydrolase family 25 protein [Ilyomonas limi]|uniref:Glycoside hydrolase family 25 protein n=1 Tax=Ilyomonas limi TaxID=2575867 RepID=A0A4U3KQ45_9BACT|nr:GH25 family lysozyme [Ilyomonas limi]TKK64312.1 glycoside hydrolase family 25 protein [Ilyomonas limi]
MQSKKSKNKKRKRRRQLLYVIVLILAAYFCYSIFDFWSNNQQDKLQFVHYDGFGIDVPVGYTLHGIDVSRHQGAISWRAVRDMQIKDIRFHFAFMKATEGVKMVDPYFKRNWKSCKKMHLSRGAYHYYLANKSGADQALNFIKTVKLEPGDLPPVVDIEQLHGTKPAMMRAELKLFLNMIETHYNAKPIIYSYVDFYERYLGEEFDNYPLWIAHYLQKERPRIKREWIFWQFNEGGRVNGILSNTDFNVFNGDSAAFEELLIQP